MAQEEKYGVFPPEESGLENGLTPIHGRIHCAATPDTTEPENENENELDGIAIDHFLDTLAEVAMAVARRRQQLDS